MFHFHSRALLVITYFCFICTVCSIWGNVQKLGCMETLGSKGDDFFGLHLHKVVQGTTEPRALKVPN